MPIRTPWGSRVHFLPDVRVTVSSCHFQLSPVEQFEKKTVASFHEILGMVRWCFEAQFWKSHSFFGMKPPFSNHQLAISLISVISTKNTPIFYRRRREHPFRNKAPAAAASHLKARDRKSRNSAIGIPRTS